MALASLLRSWDAFIADAVSISNREATSTEVMTSWIKADHTRVTDLDLRIDTALRICLAKHFPDASVLSEEIGLLSPADGHGRTLAIVDPVDGTDSLINGRPTWWVSVGFLEGSVSIAGLIYQPTTGRLHHSAAPLRRDCDHFVVGMSPDRLTAADTAELRSRLERVGAELVGMPHAVEKVAAVLEGRSAASVFLPSRKSPSWRSWDLAAAFAVAVANGLVLKTLAGEPPRFDRESAERREPWICAQNDKIWNVIYQELRYS